LPDGPVFAAIQDNINIGAMEHKPVCVGKLFFYQNGLNSSSPEGVLAFKYQITDDNMLRHSREGGNDGDILDSLYL
jgi:hypothetical protein